MPETMPWKQGLIYLAVLMIIPTSTSMTMDFCNGSETVNSIELVYRNASDYTLCICHVQHTAPRTKNYTVESVLLKGSSDRDGGYYNLSFISGGEVKSVVNKTIGNEKLFTSSQDITSNITLQLSDFSRRPKILKIFLFSGDTSRVKLKIMCDHIDQPKRTETTTTVTESSVLPSTGNKESDSTIPIAGGVIGGLLCIAVGIIIVFILCRRNKLNEEGPSSKTSHDNPVYGAPGPDVIYDLPNHVTEKSHDSHENDAAKTPMDSNYFTLEDNGGNEGYSYLSPSNVGHTDGRPSLEKTENQEENDDCYNHTNVAAESRDRPKGDNYVNVAARTREDYDHIKPNTGFTLGPLSNPSDKDEDSYNHQGQIPFQNIDSEDCYNHLGPSSSQPSTEDCYNHIGQHFSQATINPEDCYNHLGLLPSQSTMDSDDGYSRAGNITPQTMNAEDCYNHLR